MYIYNPLISLGLQKLQPTGSGYTNLVMVESITDFPPPVGNVITLSSNTTYYILTNIDLNGNRVIMSFGTTLLGTSSETSSLTSTGLGNEPLITCNYENPIRHLSIKDVQWGFESIYSGNRISLDWTGVNFINIPKVGVLDGAENFIFDKGTFINSEGLSVKSSIFTFSIMNTLLSSSNSSISPILHFEDNLVVNRRIRILYSSFIVLANEGIRVGNSVSIPAESFILTGVNFSGPGTMLSGISDLDLPHNVTSTTGITNSTAVVNMYIKNNTVPTTFTSVNQRRRVLGMSLSNPYMQKFTHETADNTVTYISNIERQFRMTCTMTIYAPNNNVIGIYIAICKNGNTLDPDTDRITESEVYITANGSRPDVAVVQCIRPLATGDRVYILVQNKSGTGNVTVEFLNLLVEKSQ